MTSSNDDDKEADGSNEEYFTTVEHSFKHQERQPKDHFEILLKATCLNHVYPIKHKLKDTTMMKNFMTSGGLAKGKKPEGDPSGTGAAFFPREAAIMMIYG
jgi:hypothetical protein